MDKQLKKKPVCMRVCVQGSEQCLLLQVNSVMDGWWVELPFTHTLTHMWGHNTSHTTHCCQTETGNKQCRASVFKQRFPLCRWMRWSSLPALRHRAGGWGGWHGCLFVREPNCANNISRVRGGIFLCSFTYLFINEEWYRCLPSKQQCV